MVEHSLEAREALLRRPFLEQPLGRSEVAQDRAPRPEGWRFPLLNAAADADPGPAAPGALRHLLDQPGLADAGGAMDDRKLWLTGFGGAEQAHQVIELGVATDEGVRGRRSAP